MNDNKVYADLNNIVYYKMPEIQQVYPVIFYVDADGHFKSFEYVSPENPNSIEHLTAYMKITGH